MVHMTVPHTTVSLRVQAGLVGGAGPCQAGTKLSGRWEGGCKRKGGREK